MLAVQPQTIPLVASFVAQTDAPPEVVTAGLATASDQDFEASHGLSFPAMAALLFVYFYAHCGFASITAHILAMYPAFLALLMAKQAPVGLVVFSFACFDAL